MQRVAVLGNSGGGKSTLSRQLAARFDLPCTDLDCLLWLPGWQLASEEVYRAEHARLIAGERWLLDGLGMHDSIAARLARATHVVLIDMPLWMHYWLAAERQILWEAGRLPHPPAGIAEAPPIHGLFKAIWENDQAMPEIRALVDLEERRGKRVFRLASVEDLDGFLSRQARGAGGGGAVWMTPVGALEIGPRGARFVRFRSLAPWLGAAALGLAIGWMLGRRSR